jgi:indolepyruvate ferredoxin oxidoreductase, beta subunit
MKLDIVFAGVGGQGIVVASDILCQAALLDGFSVAKSEIHGIAKRGGSVDAHIRIGHKVSCPVIERGTSDIILGFELLESVRALPMLKQNGKVIVNTNYLPPTSVLQGLVKSPRKEDLIAALKKRAMVYEVDTNVAAQTGGGFSVNVVLLGALLASTDYLVSEKSIKSALLNRFSAQNLNVNLAALRLGEQILKVPPP